jgi:protein-S-isoprenylcysteine O-methyltransferase Ste14
VSRPTRRDLARNIVFVILVPGVVGGLVPLLITRYEYAGANPQVPFAVAVAWVFIGVGSAVLLYGVWRFAADGRGTPAPVAPTEHLVVSGPYRYVRNPMYLAVGAVIAGQALLLASLALLVYLAVYAIAVVLFVRLYEEPTLRRTFGAEYEAYCADVPAWWPRRPRLTRPR